MLRASARRLAKNSASRALSLEMGCRFDPSWRMYFEEEKECADGEAVRFRVSPWHDLPLHAQVRRNCPPGARGGSSTGPPGGQPTAGSGGARYSEGSSGQCGVSVSVVEANAAAAAVADGGGQPFFMMLNEIPLGTVEKLEVSTTREHNPIVQDTFKDGKPRVFKYGVMPFNYGCFPRTFEDPDVVDPRTGLRGDGDPLDVVDLSGEALAVGDVVAVRLLGALALIDQGETDWKMLVVPTDSCVRAISDVPKARIDAVVHWFRHYKTADGKPQNEFAFDAAVQPVEAALDVVGEAARQYDELLAGRSKSCERLWLPGKAASGAAEKTRG